MTLVTAFFIKWKTFCYINFFTEKFRLWNFPQFYLPALLPSVLLRIQLSLVMGADLILKSQNVSSRTTISTPTLPMVWFLSFKITEVDESNTLTIYNEIFSKQRYWMSLHKWNRYPHVVSSPKWSLRNFIRTSEWNPGLF